MTKIPHLILLLFAGNEITLSNPGKKNSRKCKRIILNGWIEMEITELQLAIFRCLQKEIEKLLILYVEKNLTRKQQIRTNQKDSKIIKEEVVNTVKEKTAERNYEQEILHDRHLLRDIVRILLRNQ